MAEGYNEKDVIDTYRALGVGPGKVVFVTSDLGRLMNFVRPGKQAILEAHAGALLELLAEDGTLVVPTATTNLCNTDIPFDPDTTPSHRMGVLSEYVRALPGAKRSFHPFRSYAAIGRRAGDIVDNVCRNGYGPGTPEARMIDLDTLSVSVGLEPNMTSSTVHHCEHVMNVPYRYTKEFLHPVVRDGKIVEEPFYLPVWYEGCGVERDFCRKIMQHFRDNHEVTEMTLGRGPVFSYRMSDFYQSTIRLMMEDPYVWCEKPPTDRPWRK